MTEPRKLTKAHIERWFARAGAKMKKMASQELAAHLSATGAGADDGGYNGSYSTVVEEPGGTKKVLYSQFIDGVCVQAVSIPFDDMKSMAMEYVIEPAYAESQLKLAAPARPSIWKPGDE